jgi:hypothetical protein
VAFDLVFVAMVGTTPDTGLSRTGPPRGYCSSYLLLKKNHVQIHQIHVGIRYKHPIHYQARANNYVPNHGNPGGLLSPIHV